MDATRPCEGCRSSTASRRLALSTLEVMRNYPCCEMYTVPSWRLGGLAKNAGDYCPPSPVRERSSLSRAVNATSTVSLHRERNGSI
jgi:hypothetical protein